jgi:hypothetical protein
LEIAPRFEVASTVSEFAETLALPSMTVVLLAPVLNPPSEFIGLNGMQIIPLLSIYHWVKQM